MPNKKEFKPWENPQETLSDAVKQTRTTKEVEEGQLALKGIQEKMRQVFKKDQALKISMYVPETKPSRQEESGLREAKRPWWCPRCGHSMIGKADDRMWILRGKCHRCVIREETQLRLEGKWESYEQERILSNQIAYIRDRISELKDIQRTISNPENHFSDGTFERWNVGVDKIKADLQDEINQLEHLLCQAERLYEEKFGAVGK